MARLKKIKLKKINLKKTSDPILNVNDFKFNIKFMPNTFHKSRHFPHRASFVQVQW